MGERRVDPEMHAQAMERLGLNKPLPEQYLDYVSKLAQGDLGESLRTRESVWTEFLALFPATLELALAALFFAGVIGLLAGVIINQGNSHQAIYFKNPQGRDGYFTAQGQSMKRAFLKSPMPFDRISSGFSSGRLHPVLQIWRAHKGVDYAAPTGTPVRAIADAKVSFVGKQGGYGNLIVLNHQSPYSTAYGHLSRFGKGIKRGGNVSQGQIIGYVGATGLASGPHLHYEFRVNGAQRNPLAMKLPTAYPLEGRYKAQFAAHAQPLVARLNLLRNTNLAKLD